VNLRIDARAGASSIIIAALVVGLLLGAAASYWLYALPGRPDSGLVYSSQETSSAVPFASSSSQSSYSQDASQTSSTLPFASASSGSRYPALTFATPPGAVSIIIPDGIDLPTARQLNVTFMPPNIRVVSGVNSTIYFLNKDIDFTLGHVIQTTVWPGAGAPFVFNSLPGEVTKVTLTSPGVYNYTCIWHPIWMQGSITVVGHGA